MPKLVTVVINPRLSASALTKRCPYPLKLNLLLLSHFDGKGCDYGKEEIFGWGRY